MKRNDVIGKNVLLEINRNTGKHRERSGEKESKKE